MRSRSLARERRSSSTANESLRAGVSRERGFERDETRIISKIKERKKVESGTRARRYREERTRRNELEADVN